MIVEDDTKTSEVLKTCYTKIFTDFFIKNGIPIKENTINIQLIIKGSIAVEKCRNEKFDIISLDFNLNLTADYDSEGNLTKINYDNTN